MKKIITVILLFTFGLVNSQTISGIILDSITKKPLDLANIIFLKTKYGVYTNELGEFKIKISDNTDDLFISNIGYNSFKIHLSEFKEKKEYYKTFFLSPKNTQLDEVVIISKKKHYSSDKSINSNRESTQYLGFQFGTENCLYIENPYKKRGIVESISLELKKIRDHARQCRECEVDYISSFCVKFYEYDSVNKKPSNEIYNKNIIINPKNKNYTLKINLDSLKISFPEKGMCVGIETINTKYIKPKKTFSIIAPFIKFTKVIDKNKTQSWIRYRDENWVFKPLLNRDKRGNKPQYNNIIIDAVVKIEN